MADPPRNPARTRPASASPAGFVGRATLGLTGVVAVGVALAVVAALVASRWAPLQALDTAVVDAANDAVGRRPAVVSVLRFLTNLGGAEAAWLLLPATAAWLLLRRSPRLALYVAVTGIGLLVLDRGTKALVGRVRHASGGAQEMEAALEQAGVPVLDNEAQAVPGDGDLYVVGLGPARMDRVDVDAALRGIPEDAPRVVLMHNPTTFPALPARSAPLALAGHTHCGQIALPGRPHWSYLQLSQEEALVAGGYAFDAYGEPGNRLFVTCGVGFSLLPLRVNAPPQVVFFELQPES